MDLGSLYPSGQRDRVEVKLELTKEDSLIRKFLFLTLYLFMLSGNRRVRYGPSIVLKTT